MVVCFLCESLEWRFEVWTLKGERITIYRKPPLKNWSLIDAVAFRKPVEIEDRGDGDADEGIELR